MGLGKKTIDDENYCGKKVLVRCDFNVPMKDGVITNENRINAALPTIQKLINDGAKVILCSHLGKPKNGPEAKFSLAPVAKALSAKLGKDVVFADDDNVVGEQAKAAVAAMNNGDVVLLQNTRFRKEETKNIAEFSEELASLADAYVDDAFGSCHRAHCSTAGVTDYIKDTAVGYLMEKEIRYLGNAVNDPVRPFTAILGGAKVADKLNVISNLLEKVDTLIIGGGMAYTFIKAQGYEIGKSLCDDSKIDYCKEMMEKAKANGVGIVSARNSNHYGIAGYYAQMACKEGLMGFSCTNSEAIMVPTFGRKALLGSNPIACAFPANPYDFFFDVSTTVVTRGKLEMYNKMEKPLPEGWALDKDGHPSSDAPDVLANIVAKAGGGIMPLGGSTEQLGSHKGYGFGMLCEIFSSILSMGSTSNVCMTGGRGNICHGFAAINPAFFGDPQAIKAHFSEYLQALRDSPKADGQQRIYTHGEKEVFAVQDRLDNGIPVNDNTMMEVLDLCQYLGLDFGSYFGDYRPPVKEDVFKGNY